ncbi:MULTISPECIES: hypothetical protein [unclassified Leucobacter]|uniref:hypothetical protein n=1 Tax=unclassified Leucobacter TaxID=2621730 RepID=UPI00165E5CBE|nr:MULTISPECIES: hypothetical protein [unclassified Leucobacter]MBC9926129.1 hypothetical protein [Leucobacter sp. cx-169]
MSIEQNPQYDSRALDQTQRAMGAGAQHEVLRAAMRRAAGSPTPTLDPQQSAMGAEGQIRAVARGLFLVD